MTGWKTFIFNMAIMFWGVLEAFDWTSVLGEWGAFVLISVGAIGTVLRAFTKTPWFSKVAG